MNDEKDQGATDLSDWDHDEEEVIIFLADNRGVNGGKGPTVKNVLEATGIDEGCFNEFKDVAKDLFAVPAGSDTPPEKRYVNVKDKAIAAARKIRYHRGNRASNAVKWLCRLPVIGPVIGLGKTLGPFIGAVGGIFGVIAWVRGC